MTTDNVIHIGRLQRSVALAEGLLERVRSGECISFVLVEHHADDGLYYSLAINSDLHKLHSATQKLALDLAGHLP
jgi:hypothetical protein